MNRYLKKQNYRHNQSILLYHILPPKLFIYQQKIQKQISKKIHGTSTNITNSSTTYVDHNITYFNRRYHQSRIKIIPANFNIAQSTSVLLFSDIKRKGSKINVTDFLGIYKYTIL